MKQVFANHREVCHVWAQQKQTEGRASRIFFDGPRIYSYGRHFEMARFIRPDLVFITTKGYSVSTSKHIRYVLGAVSHIKSFTVPSFDCHPDNVRYFLTEIMNYSKLAARAVKKGEWFIREMVAAGESLKDYLEVFKKDIPKELRKEALKELTLLSTTDYSKILERSRAAIKKDREEARKAAIETAKQEAENIELWREWKYHGRISGSPLLRAKDGIIETSFGARVPLDLAVLMFKRLKSGAPVHGITLGNYTITSFDGSILTVGCHKIELSEMERLYSTLEVK